MVSTLFEHTVRRRVLVHDLNGELRDQEDEPRRIEELPILSSEIMNPTQPTTR